MYKSRHKSYELLNRSLDIIKEESNDRNSIKNLKKTANERKQEVEKLRLGVFKSFDNRHGEKLGPTIVQKKEVK